MKHQFSLFILLIGLLAYSCKKEKFYEGDLPQVRVSIDTLTFDTVFTTIGSATKEFKVYNDESVDILVDISLDEDNLSMFRLNIDGTAGNTDEDILIRAHDSIYVFADVTIDPNDPVTVSPFIIEEYITVSSGNQERKVLMEAYGQNANYIPGSNKKGTLSLLSCDLGTETWDDPKPYVIYGILFIDSCEVIIPQGTDIYIHGGVVTADGLLYNDGIIQVLKDGRITANGTATEPITIQGDRLEESYEFLPGQWGGIVFRSESTGNKLSHVHLKNSIIGYRVDSLASLKMDHCDINNTVGQGLIGYHSDIEMANSLVHSTGSEAVVFTYGGNYKVVNSTMTSYNNQSVAVYLNNFHCFDSDDCAATTQINALNVEFVNSIITGSDHDELSLADYNVGMNPSLFQYKFENCIVKIEKLLEGDYSNFLIDDCEDCLNFNGIDPLFTNEYINDFSLDTLSVAIDRGRYIGSITDDIKGNNRDATPDIGCYEYQY